MLSGYGVWIIIMGVWTIMSVWTVTHNSRNGLITIEDIMKGE
jgi:hypothetical protein